jgi:oligoendopeptidase F
VRHLGRQTDKVLKDKLGDDRAEVRAAAAKVVAAKGLRLGSELIELLSDADERVREAAHQALVKLNRGTDYGPSARATDEERAAAIKKWRDWWAKQNKR